MIYLALEYSNGGDIILGASRSEDGAKRIIEKHVRNWWGHDLTWRPDTTSFEDDDEIQVYLRRSGRTITGLVELPDYQVRVIEQVED